MRKSYQVIYTINDFTDHLKFNEPKREWEKANTDVPTWALLAVPVIAIAIYVGGMFAIVALGQALGLI